MSISEKAASAPDVTLLHPEAAAETELIVRLAKEVLSSRSPFPTTPASLPSTVAEGDPGRGYALPAISSGTSHEDSLAGGYPHASPQTHPPVHPVLITAGPEAISTPASVAHPPSGAHDPSSGDSYAFGEPRCNGSVFGPSAATSLSKAEPTKPKFETGPAPQSGLPTSPTALSPEFYFLRARDHVAKPALPGMQREYSSSLSSFDVEAIRRDFPALHQRVNGKPLVWLDNAATTHKPQSVIDATSLFYSRDNSNIHRAAHTLAARSTELFENGREKVRQFLGAAETKEIVFVRGTTEAINLVAQSYGRKNIAAGDEILLTRLEHHANIVPWQLLAQQTDAVLRVAPINDRGELILEEFAKMLNSRTKIVSVTHVSNALGTVNPVEMIIKLAHAHGVPVLVDGAQSTPHLPINVQALDADFFVFSGHKFSDQPVSVRFMARRHCSKPCRRGRAAAT